MVYLFVVKFDMIEGFSLIHLSEKLANKNTHQKNKIVADQLEHRAIPSGLHYCESDTIRFLQSVKTIGQNGESDERIMKATAFFLQNGFQLKNDDLESNTIDRAKIKMFSVGILYDEQTENVLQNALLIEKLKLQLKEFVNQEKSSKADLEERQFVDELTETFNNVHFNPQKTASAAQYFKENIEKVSQTANHFGPFIFRIWRALLTGKRVLLENEFHKNKDFDGQEEFHGPVDVNTCLIEVLENCCHGISSGERLQVDFLYNLTLHDVSKAKNSKKGYIASTSEELLVSQWNMTKFDYLLTISGSSQMVRLQKVISGSSSTDVRLQEVKFTATDMTEFLNIMEIIGEGRGFVPADSWRSMTDNSWLAIINGLLYGSSAKNGLADGIDGLSAKDYLAEDSPESEATKYDDDNENTSQRVSLMGNDMEHQLDRMLLGYLRVLNGESGEIQRRGQIAFTTAAKMGLAPLAYDDYEFCVNLYNRWVAQQEEPIEVGGRQGGWVGSLLRLVWN